MTLPKPKGYISAFNFFFEANHKEFKLQHPTLSPNEAHKLLGQKWKQLNPEERSHWKKMGEDDKLRYLKELSEYNFHNDVDVAPRIDPPRGYDYSGSIAVDVLKLKPSKRFQSAYNLFVKQERQIYASFYSGEKSKSAMGRSASLRWKSMCQEEKDLYVALEKCKRVVEAN